MKLEQWEIKARKLNFDKSGTSFLTAKGTRDFPALSEVNLKLITDPSHLEFLIFFYVNENP